MEGKQLSDENRAITHARAGITFRGKEIKLLPQNYAKSCFPHCIKSPHKKAKREHNNLLCHSLPSPSALPFIPKLLSRFLVVRVDFYEETFLSAVSLNNHMLAMKRERESESNCVSVIYGRM
jgi:hypothetical protein